MGYSSRYHAASLAAVFVALAVGIVIGAALGSDVVSGTASNLEEDLGEDLDRLRAENQELREELEFERSFAEAIYPTVVDNRLTGQSIALIGLGEIDSNAYRDLAQMTLDGTGAELTEVATVREPPDAEALLGELGPDARSGLSRDDALRAAARRAGRLLVGRGSNQSALDVLLSGFSGEATGIRGVLLARAPRGDWSQRERREVELVEEGLVEGMMSAGVRVVGIERVDDEDSSIAYFDELPIPSVDNLDQIQGRVAAVLALDGADGSYGVKDTSDSLLPELIDPASEPEPEG